jgi:hypothetical protein
MAIFYTYLEIMVRFLSTVVYVQTNLEENNGTNIYVGHSKSIFKTWLGIISMNTNPIQIISRNHLHR